MSLDNATQTVISLVYLGERPEAMQTGTSTYIANNIMRTIFIGIIISTFNIFQNYYLTMVLVGVAAIGVMWQKLVNHIQLPSMQMVQRYVHEELLATHVRW